MTGSEGSMIPGCKHQIRQTAAACAMLAACTLAATSGFGEELEKVRPVFQHIIPNAPGKRLVAVVVSYPPGGRSPAHRHAGSAFIYAHVLTGAIRSRVGDGPAQVYGTGESFFEEPGAHHLVSENASKIEPASLLAIFVVDDGDGPLTVPDPGP
jgi:quercetin dioxygenase-like cupin family protein